VGTIATVPFLVGGAFFGHHDQSVVALLMGLAVRVVAASFAALASALLYYDLVVRSEAEAEPATTPAGPTQLDPRAYSDQKRPKGWYVDPTSPSRMRHWGGPERPSWNGNTRTPRKIKQQWTDDMGRS
jgi:hypothetical protein